jgi:hypothetical protein
MDDIQDVLITALTLGRPILTRLPTRVVPILGWALLANDVLNASVALLSVVTSGRIAKASVYKSLLSSIGGRAARVNRAETFLKGRLAWIPFLLQAGQVLKTFTGWGLQLGGVMGASTDIAWGAVGALRGEPLKLIAPPPSDPINKAWRVLSRASFLPFLAPLVNPSDLPWLTAGFNTAVQWLTDELRGPADDDRLGSLAADQIKTIGAWEPSTRAALTDAGEDPDGMTDLPLPAGNTNPTLGAAAQSSALHVPDLESTMQSILAGAEGESIAAACAREAADTCLDVYGGPGAIEKVLTPFERLMGMAIERNVFPPWATDETDAQWWRDFTHQTLRLTVDNRKYWSTDVDGSEINPEYGFPITYPPHASKELAIQHWLQIAQWLYCGAALPLPLFHLDLAQHSIDIQGWTLNDRRRGLYSLELASILVWGNVWQKEPREPSTEHAKTKDNLCPRSPSGALLLYGKDSDPWEWLPDPRGDEVSAEEAARIQHLAPPKPRKPPIAT